MAEFGGGEARTPPGRPALCSPEVQIQSTVLIPGRLRRLIGAPLLLLLAACYTWQEIQPAELAVRAPDEVRVVLTDGTQRTLTDPRLIESDSVLLGFAKDPDGSPVGLAIAEIRAIEVREANEVVTVVMVVGMMVAAFVVACNSAGCSPF